MKDMLRIAVMHFMKISLYLLVLIKLRLSMIAEFNLQMQQNSD